MKIRSDVLRTYQSVHTWTGITTGLLLFIGFFAGALTMFQQAIDDWATPPQTHYAPLPESQLNQLLQQSLQQHPKSASYVELTLDGSQSPISWFEQGHPRELEVDASRWHGTLDAQGGLVAEVKPVNALADLIDYLHRSAGIFGELGHDHVGVYVLGVAAMLYFIALISGLIFLLPTLVKSFFALRTNKGASRFWLDSHNLVGISSLPFHLLIAFTVVVFAFHDFFYAGLKVAVYGKQPMFERPLPAAEAYQPEHLPDVTALLAQVRAYAPEYQPVKIQYSGLDSKRPQAVVQVASDTALMRGPITDLVMINPYSLDIFASTFPADEDGIWQRIVASFFGLHFGSFGGNSVRWLYFFMGLAGAFLFYSGNLLWLEKRRAKAGKQQPRSVTVMAKLTVGVAIGTMLGVALAISSTKWLAATSINPNHAYLWLYYLGFFAAIGWSFYQGAAKAAIHLLGLSALVSLSIPCASLIGALWPALGPWPSLSNASLMVDLSAALFALAFAWAARQTYRRAYQGPRDSLWALPAH